MPINFDKALGSHETALMIQARRMSVLATNISNSDTPGYKARDIDFEEALKQAKAGKHEGMLKTTQKGHIQPEGANLPGGELQYRTPLQQSPDGNTVDLQKEKASYAENAVRYQATLRFLTGRFKSMIGALKGE